MKRRMTKTALAVALMLAAASPLAAQTAAQRAEAEEARAAAEAARAEAEAARIDADRERANADEQQAKAREELRRAQGELARLSREVARLSAEIGSEDARVQVFRYLGDPDRAVIGVVLGDTRKEGVAVAGVTPGGPADKAGLKAGDVITSVRGKDIGGEEPMAGLRAALRGLKDGDAVDIGYLRNGRSGKATVTAARQAGIEGFAGRPGMSWFFDESEMENILPPGFERDIEAIIERRRMDHRQGHGDAMGEAFAFAFGSETGLRLSSLNPGLAKYFGVSEGALVLEVDGEYEGLEAGDVILSVNGKDVTSPREALRQLRGQEAGEKVAIVVQRERKQRTVEVTVPESSRAFFGPRPPAPPAPPAPPTPPRAPAAAPMPPAPPAPTATI